MLRLSLLLAGLCLAATVGLACGPFFPWQLLDDRAAALHATPANSFAFEAAHLVPAPGDTLRANEPADNGDPGQLDTIRAQIEAEGLSRSQVDRLGRMRMAESGTEAYDMGRGMPEAMRRYVAGAVAFRAGENDAAVRFFSSVLDLPPGDRASRATWAAFMLGRTRVLLDDAEAAAAAFAQTRALAIAGAPDPLGLAVASYGEEAQLHLLAAHDAQEGEDAPPDRAMAYAQEIARAVELYAEQAARGSDSGVQSLRMVAEELLDIDRKGTDPLRLEAAVADTTTQRLLIAYALARVEDEPDAKHANPLLVRLVTAIDSGKLAQPAAADRLAALCYRIGRYDLAATLAGRAEGPLAAWVQAKLATRRGDLPAAASAYALASRAFPDADTAPLDDANRKLVVGEQGLLTLARGDYLAAMEQLYPVATTYWGDVAHIAERVLTTDELKHFAETHPPVPLIQRLLGRRLMREGRWQEAMAYFGPEIDPDTHDYASTYVRAMADSKARWWSVERARAFYAAADQARWHGMELMGTETGPDYYALGGNYEGGTGQMELKGPFISAIEKTRFAATAAKPDLRYHYRYVAADLASQAADLLPPRSQAFAAVLCHATEWMLSVNDPRAGVLYQRYLTEGPAIPWAAHFGSDCPDPDFDAAARFPREQAVRVTRHFVRVNRWPLGGGMVFAVAGLALMLRRVSATG